MAVHVVMAEDWRAGGPRSVTWDDETGEIGGEHVAVDRIRCMQADAERGGRYAVEGVAYRMPDPRLDPACVKALLGLGLNSLLVYDELPEPLRTGQHKALIEPRPPPAPGVIDD